MYYRSPHVIRKGKIPMITSSAGGSTAYGAYGASWAPRQRRLNACPEMNSYYQEWLGVMQEKKRKCKWPYLGGCAKKYRNEQASLERKGKAAWDVCQGMGKVEEAQADDPISFYPDVLPSGGGQFPMTTVTPGGGQTTTTPSDPYYEEEEEDDGLGGTMLIMGLVGGSALLLLLLLKK